VPDAQSVAIWSAICREIGTAEPFSIRKNMAQTPAKGGSQAQVTTVL
jgi:hypothetical protein